MIRMKQPSANAMTFIMTPTGTLASAYYFRDQKNAGFKYITVDGEASIDKVKEQLMSQL